MTRAIPLMAAVVLAAPVAFAQGVHPDCPEDPGDEQQAQAEAGRWFEKGELLVKQSKFDEGMGAFLCAYALAPHPAPIFNAGQAAASGGDDENAVKLLRQYLMIAPDGPMAPIAREQLAELEARGAGAPPPPVAQPVEQPPPPPEEEEEAPWDVPEEQPEPADDAGGGAMTTAGIVLVAVGAAGLVAGAVLQGLAGKAVKDGEAADDYDVFKDERDKVDGFQKGALAGFIVGGVLAVTGVILIAVDSGGEEPAAEISLAPAPGGVVLGGTF